MITIGELKNICNKLEKEYGSDIPVILQMRNDDGSLDKGDYCLGFCRDSSGTLFLTNKPFKWGNCE